MAKVLPPNKWTAVLQSGETNPAVRHRFANTVRTSNFKLSNGKDEQHAAKKLVSIREFNDALPGHVPPDAASQERVGTIISRLEEIASL